MSADDDDQLQAIASDYRDIGLSANETNNTPVAKNNPIINYRAATGVFPLFVRIDP